MTETTMEKTTADPQPDAQKTEQPGDFTDAVQKRIAAVLLFDEEPTDFIHPDMFDNPAVKALTFVGQEFRKKYHRPITDDELLEEFKIFIDSNKKKGLPIEEYWNVCESVISLKDEDTAYPRARALEFARYQAIRRAIIDSADIVKYGKDHNKILEKVRAALALGVKEEADVPAKSILASDLKEEEMEWLWPSVFPKAELSYLAGMPEVGKSFFTMMLAARVSSGRPFPSRPGVAAHRAERGSVIILQYEDRPTITCKRRLSWEEADQSKICFITGTGGRDEDSRDIDLSTDLDQVRATMRELGNVKLIIVDPLPFFVGSQSNMNSNSTPEVRRALRPLMAFIEEEKVAVVGIMHTNKNQMADVLHRIAGAAGWGQVPRVIWMIAEDRTDPELRWFLALKNNTISKTEKHRAEFGFRILENHIVVAENEQPISIQEAVGPELPEDATERRGKMKVAIAFLEEQKAKGTKEIPAQEVMEAMKDIGKRIWYWIF
jgi:hypothetical protein